MLKNIQAEGINITFLNWNIRLPSFGNTDVPEENIGLENICLMSDSQIPALSASRQAYRDIRSLPLRVMHLTVQAVSSSIFSIPE
jgi:hypothetical protein